MNVKRFTEITKNVPFATVDHFVELCDEDGHVWEPEDTDKEEALLRSKRQAVRQALRQVTDESGRPVFKSVRVPSVDGLGEEEQYKNRAFCEFADWQYSINANGKHLATRLENVLRDMDEAEELTGERPTLPLGLERLIQKLV